MLLVRFLYHQKDGFYYVVEVVFFTSLFVLSCYRVFIKSS